MIEDQLWVVLVSPCFQGFSLSRDGDRSLTTERAMDENLGMDHTLLVYTFVRYTMEMIGLMTIDFEHFTTLEEWVLILELLFKLEA